MNVKDVCVYLKISRLTVYSLLKQKDIPAFRVAREWRFQKSALDEWMKQKTISPDV